MTYGALDPELWDLTRNPRLILQSIAPEKVEQLSADDGFRARMENLAVICAKNKNRII